MRYSLTQLFGLLPLILLTSPHHDFLSNEPIMASLAKPVHKKLVHYVHSFLIVLDNHMNNEFEVQIRSGSITDEGKHVLRKLNRDYITFQYRDQIHEIVYNFKEILLGQPLDTRNIELVNGIEP